MSIGTSILVPTGISLDEDESQRQQKKHISLGLQLEGLDNSPALVLFTHKLNKALNPQNIFVYHFGEWFEHKLTDEPNRFNFELQFTQATERAEHIHFNLQRICDPVSYANAASPGIFGMADFPAVELYRIKKKSVAMPKNKFL